MEHLIREVTDADWDAVTEVFNHFIRHSLAAYPDQAADPEFFRTKRSRCADYPFLVVEVEGEVVGFAYLSPFHFASTMRSTAALTYFLHPSVTGGGIGTELLDRLVREGRGMGVTNFLANVSSHNDGSLRFHRRHGFVECGRFLQVGVKMGRPFDMVWMQRFDAGRTGGSESEAATLDDGGDRRRD